MITNEKECWCFDVVLMKKNNNRCTTQWFVGGREGFGRFYKDRRRLVMNRICPRIVPALQRMKQPVCVVAVFPERGNGQLLELVREVVFGQWGGAALA